MDFFPAFRMWYWWTGLVPCYWPMWPAWPRAVAADTRALLRKVILRVPLLWGQSFRQWNLAATRQLCGIIVLQSLSSGAMFWRLALHVFLAKQFALPGYNVLLFTWTQTGFLTVSMVKAEMWWSEKCVFLDLYATKSNIVVYFLSSSWPFMIRVPNIRMLSSSGKLLLIMQVISLTIRCTLKWNRLLFLGVVIFSFIQCSSSLLVFAMLF